MTVSGEYVVMQ